MLQLRNRTPFIARLMLLADRRGIDTLYAVVKGTFSLGYPPTPADAQLPLALADEHHGDPTASSIRVPSDVSLEKPGTDVLLSGSAWAPGGQPVWHTDVSIEVGPVAKVARVFGDRVWKSGAAGTSVAWLTPFVQMPLVWERAYGGADETDKGPTTDPRNPVGVGFRAPNSVRPLTGLPLPNVEDPSALISSWKDAPAPTGFGAVGAHWMPRRSYAGTYDDAWVKRRAPYLPDDFDPRFCQVAPVGLAAPRPLEGGEVVDVRGATPSGWLRVVLPRVAIHTTYQLDRGSQSYAAALDTVIIEPDANRLVLVWRAAMTCDKKALRVREVETTVAGLAAGAAT
jgi:hypothetical protein